MRLKIAFMMGVLILSSCDTSINIKDPNSAYFIKFYGGNGDQTGDDLVVLPDGSIVLFGTTKAFGSENTSDWYFVKTDPKGNVVWEKTYGGPNTEEASDIELTNDGRLVAVGNSYQSATNRDIRIMTLTLDGDQINSAVVPIYNSTGGDPLGDDVATSVSQTSDGFIVAGHTTYVTLAGKITNPGYADTRDAISVRFNNDLTSYTLNGWPTQQSYGYYSDDVSEKIFQLSDGTFYIFGYSNSPARNQTAKNYNFWYYLLGTSGTSINFNFLGVQTEDERMTSATSVPLESGEGFLLAGITTNATGNSDINVAKVKKSLIFNPPAPPSPPPIDELFQKSFAINLGIGTPEKTAVFATKSNSFYVLANENSSNNQNWILTKGSILDGSPLWKLPIVFGGEGLDACGSVQELPDGKVLIIGTMRTGRPDTGEFKMTLMKVSPDGKLTE